MSWKDRPWMLYFIILLAVITAGTLWRIHEGFSIDITIELLGAIITIIIIDELLLKSKRKRWNLVKNEVQYILARTVNIIRSDILRDMFFFSPELKENKDMDSQERFIREQKDEQFNKLLNMSSEKMLEILEKGFLKQEYEDYFKEHAEDLWRILNTRYSEHLEPEVVEELLKLDLHLRDLHNSIRIYKRGVDKQQKKYYQELGGRNIVYNTKNIIQILVNLKKMGYSQIQKR
jgi:hypothetical protein